MSAQEQPVEQARILTESGLTSFKVARNSRGYTWEAKVYAASNDPYDQQRALEQLHTVTADLDKRYPADGRKS